MPCADSDAGDYMITQEQIDYLGDELTDQIVRSTRRTSARSAPDAADPSSDSLVMLVYNVQDDTYYDCDETPTRPATSRRSTSTSAGMNVIVIDAFDWANRVGDRTGWTDATRNDRPSSTRASSPTSSSTCS